MYKKVDFQDLLQVKMQKVQMLANYVYTYVSNEDRRHANEYKRRQENILQISKAENVQYKINNFTSHTFNSGSSYDAELDG